MNRLSSATLGMLYAMREEILADRSRALVLFGFDENEADTLISASHDEMMILSENLTPALTLKVTPVLSASIKSPLIRFMSRGKAIV